MDISYFDELYHHLISHATIFFLMKSTFYKKLLLLLLRIVYIQTERKVHRSVITKKYLVVKILRKLCQCVVVLLACNAMQAQDIHFTQFYAMPLLQNPANTGQFKGDCRFNGIYRNQWRSVDGQPYSTIGLSFDKQFYYFTQQINGGVLFLNDRSGYAPLSSTKFYLSGSALKLVNRHKLYAGIQAGIIYKYNDINKLTFDNQYHHGGEEVFNPDFDNGEETLEAGFAYFNLNIGVSWSKKLSEKMTPKAGIALSNLTRPNESFSGERLKDTSVLALKKTFHGELIYTMSPKMDLVPRLMYQSQKKASSLMAGANLEYKMSEENSTVIYGGGMFRYGWSKNYDAAAWIIGARFKEFDMSVSFDLNISQLQEATKNRGAFEIAVSYICPSTQPLKIKVPCDRY